MKKLLTLIFLVYTYSAYCQSNIKLPYTIEGYDTFVFENNGILYSQLGKACFDGEIDSLQILMNNGFNYEYCAIDDIYAYDVLWIAMDRANIIMLDTLIKMNIPINGIYSDDGSNVLTKACSISSHNISYEIVKLLLDNGLNVNGVGDVGGVYTIYPIVIAAEKNNTKVVELLIDRGARVNVSTAGVSPLDAAKKNKNIDIQELILKNKSH